MKIEFKGREAILNETAVPITGGKLPVKLVAEKPEDGGEDLLYYVDVDGVEWLVTDNISHAVVLFHLIADHITEYVNYTALKGSTSYEVTKKYASSLRSGSDRKKD